MINKTIVIIIIIIMTMMRDVYMTHMHYKCVLSPDKLAGAQKKKYLYKEKKSKKNEKKKMEVHLNV